MASGSRRAPPRELPRWPERRGATAYTLYRSKSESGGNSEVHSGASTEYADDGLLYAATYYYRVSARNSVGESDPSAAASGTTHTPDGFTVTR